MPLSRGRILVCATNGRIGAYVSWLDKKDANPGLDAVFPLKGFNLTITVNPHQLITLLKALVKCGNLADRYREGITIRIGAPDRAIRIDGYNSQTDVGVTGLIMPYRIEPGKKEQHGIDEV